MSRIRLFLEWLAILGCSLALVWWAGLSGVTARFDQQLLDMASAARAGPADEDTILVLIDERSLRAIGRWPWNRADVARLVDRIDAAGPRAVVLDILYTEPSGQQADEALAAAVARSGKVALPYGLAPADGRTSGFDPVPVLPQLAAAAFATGHVALDPDSDGTIRRVPLFVSDGDNHFPHLQLALHRRLEGRDPPDVADQRHAEAPAVVPLRPAGSYRAVPASAVLAGEVGADFLRGKVVMVGASAAGLGDNHPVPARAGATMAGVEIQANLRQALREQSFVRPVEGRLALALSMLAVVVLFLGFWRLRPAICLLLALLLGLGAVLAAALLAGRWGLWIAPGPAVLAIIAAYPLWGWRRLAAVSDFLASEAAGLAPAGLPAGPTLGGFDNVAKQVSLLRHLVGEVAERRAFLARVIDTAPDAICVFGADGRLVLMNPRARALFGEEPSGLTLNDLVLSVRGHLVDEGRELVLPDGGAYAVARSRATGAAAPGTEGEWAGIAVIAFIDITDIRRAEEERRHLLEFLSHDMRSPQVAILGLSDPREGHGTAEDRFARIARHARRTLKLADDFVHLSRIAEAPLAREEVDLAMLVDEALDRAWFAAREKAIRLEAVLPGDPVYVEADGDVLSRAVDNLVGNAIKYGPTGSRVTVTVLAGDAGISLAIADEGPGLPEGRREEPFRRFGPRDKAAGTGAGLGLAFVEAAVQRHGATIACRSTPGAGTTFIITFPAG